MIIEKEPLKLANSNIDQIKITGSLIGLQSKKTMKLNPMQIEILNLIAKGMSIYQIAQFFLQKKVLISFNSFRELLKFLVDENMLTNQSFKEYFQEDAPTQTSFFEDLVARLGGETDAPINVKEEMMNIPFFRSLEKNLFDTFLNNKTVVQVPSNIAVCLQGQAQRSLFAILRGEATVYKKNRAGQRQKVAVLSQGSVFGETGFFLGEPRTADVITSKNSVVVRFKYLPEVFDAAIQQETARVLQKRFWLVHALLKSEVFNCLPDDCFDSLLFSGEFKTIHAGHAICKENDHGDTCYLVVQGSLVVSQKGKSIKVLNQGDCFGEVALILNQGKRTASVTSQTDVVLLEISSKNFYELLCQNLWLACEFETIALSRWYGDKERKA